MSAVAKIITGIVIVAVAIIAAPFTGGLSLYLIPVGLSLVTQGIMQLIAGSGPKATAVEAGKVNVRLSEPIRWLNAGNARQGGGVLFAEFDSAGNLWYLVVHSDSQMNQRLKVYFDDIEVQLDGDGNVITNEFCLNDKKETYTGTGTRVPYFQIWSTTYTASDPTPPGIAALKTALPIWTDDHKLVGTTYSVVRCKAIAVEDRYKVYKWRGALGLGEPSISILGEWTLAFDPRDPTQTLGVKSTYKFTRNAALIWAWFRTHPFGRNKALASVNWTRIAEQANICDEVITGIEGTQPRYACTASIPEDKERAVAEQEILMAMDAQLVFDGDGKCWCRAGKYYVPTLTMSRNRDIIAMESLEAQNGESETQGVIVRYVEPDAKYIIQPAAPWYNPLYYVPGTSAQFLTVDIPTVDNHNQAMRLAKTMGMRSQPPHKLAPTTGLRGLQARNERVIDLHYDNTFAGDYEIYTPVEVDDAGVFCQFGIVPIGPDRFDLLLGEEKAKPVFTDGNSTFSPGAISDVSVFVYNGRIEASFIPIARDDVRYEFQYIATDDIATDEWYAMTVDPLQPFAYSGPIATDVQYSVRWRSLTSAGRPSAWSAPVTVQASSYSGTTTNLRVDGAVGQASISWRNATGNQFAYTVTYRGTTNVFDDAVAIGNPIAGGLGQYQGFTDTGLAAGTYYYWNQPFNVDDFPAGPPVGPVSGVVL
jgi:hypothetical protein